MYKIFEELKDLTNSDIRYGTAYVKKEELAIHRYTNSIKFTELANAFKTGKVANVYTIYTNTDENELDKFAMNDMLVATYDMLKKLFADNEEEVELNNGIKIYKREEKGVNTFSPMHLDNIKPLVKMPTKWNLTHAKKLLAHGATVECTGRYTDDYAYDAATNYGAGEIEALKLLEKLVESPSGWWVNPEKEGNRIGVNCHSFNYNSVYYKDELKAA